MIGPHRPTPRLIRWLDCNFVKGMGCFLCWLNMSVQMRFAMPKGSGLNERGGGEGLLVMEPVEQGKEGGQGCGMRKPGPR